MSKQVRKLAWVLLLVMVLTSTFVFEPSFAKENSVSVSIHYLRNDSNYTGWDIWSFFPNGNGAAYQLNGEDSFGKIANFTLDNTTNATQVQFIVKFGNFANREPGGNRNIDIKDGKAEIWVLQGVVETFTSEAAARAALVPKVNGTILTELNKIKLSVNIPIKLTGKDNDGISVTSDGTAQEITSIENANKVPAENLGFEVIGDKVHFILVPGKMDVPELDSKGGSTVFIAGSLNGWNANGADGWKMSWNADKKYYELTKTLNDGVKFGDEFKFINLVGKTTNWMNGDNLKIIDQTLTPSIMITLKNNLSLSKTSKVSLKGYSNTNAVLVSGNVFESKDFNDMYYYDGNDLGFTYSKDKTTFRVWAPLSQKVVLMTYKNGDIASKEIGTATEMKKDVKGTWVATLNGNQRGIFYTYKVTNYGTEVEAGDPYAVATGINGDRSAVVDLAATNPKGWNNDKKPAFSGKITDAVVYELQIRDLAMDRDSGITNKGKYLEFTETGTKGPNGVSTGIDHLKELGITHLHILPTYDYGTVDEKTLEKNDYNWGYDPKNYNVPEGSYSTDPSKPEVRITEYKQMVQSLHNNGIRTVFDAVYNHTLESSESKFSKIVPGYYFRMAEDGTFLTGTGCATETASERLMYRKYMVDSVKYWVNQYHIDGFRFDLMGIHDIATMNAIRKALTEIDPTIIIYGEAWDMGALARDKKVIQPNAAQFPDISPFNDNIRDTVKGPWNNASVHGFVDGSQNRELDIMEGVTGSSYYNDVVKDYNLNPTQSMNYVANHDNNTLYDKLSIANPNATSDELKKMDELANTIVFTSQGVSYLGSGEDFLRTKGGNSNSYISPDSVNALDWSEKAHNIDTFNYYKGLIELRKAHPAFRMTSAKQVQANLKFISSPKNTVAYTIGNNANGDTWKNIFVAYNSNKTPVTINVPSGKWNIVVKSGKAGVKTIKTIKASTITVDAMSAIVAYSNDKVALTDLFAGKKVIKTAVGSDTFKTPTAEIKATEKVSIENETIYLPLTSVVESLGYTVKTGNNGTIELIKGKSSINVSVVNNTLKIQSKEVKGGYKLVNNSIMVSKELIESAFKVKIFTDYLRYNTDTSRADNTAPDIYIVY